jgi:quercetin dioxygenase-like cupin family protein
MAKASDAYFRESPRVLSDLPWEPQFETVERVVPLVAGEGVELRPVFGHALMMSFVSMKPHSVATVHAHPEEQMGTVLEGEYEFELNGVRRLCRPGDVYVVPPGVPHGARTFERGCLALDVFAPPRGGFRELWEAAVASAADSLRAPGDGA